MWIPCTYVVILKSEMFQILGIKYEQESSMTRCSKITTYYANLIIGNCRAVIYERNEKTILEEIEMRDTFIL